MTKMEKGMRDKEDRERERVEENKERCLAMRA